MLSRSLAEHGSIRLVPGNHVARLMNLQKAQLIGHRSPSRRVAVVMRVEPNGLGSFWPRSERCQVSRGLRAEPLGLAWWKHRPSRSSDNRVGGGRASQPESTFWMSCATSVAKAGSFRFWVRDDFGGVPRVGRHDRATRMNRREPPGSGLGQGLTARVGENGNKARNRGRVEAGRRRIHAAEKRTARPPQRSTPTRPLRHTSTAPAALS